MYDIRQFGVYFDAVETYMNLPTTIYKDGGKKILKQIEKIEFRNVSFSYNGKDIILKNINLTIGRNEHLSIVGENGAGKSTFIKLLCRMYDPTEGEVLINDVNIKEIDFSDYTARVSTVFQDFKLFSWPIDENIALSSEPNTIEVQSAIEKVKLSEAIEKLAQKEKTALYRNFDHDGFEPSGGQAQRLAIARAFYKKSEITVLDEPTSALDPRAESEMYKLFNNLIKDKISVFITHRLATTKDASRILLFKDGKIVDDGDHAKLYNQNNYYRELYDLQLKQFVD